MRQDAPRFLHKVRGASCFDGLHQGRGSRLDRGRPGPKRAVGLGLVSAPGKIDPKLTRTPPLPIRPRSDKGCGVYPQNVANGDSVNAMPHVVAHGVASILSSANILPSFSCVRTHGSRHIGGRVRAISIAASFVSWWTRCRSMRTIRGPQQSGWPRIEARTR